LPFRVQRNGHILKEVDEKELVAAIEQHGLLFLQKPVMASIAASQFSAAFANR